MANFETIFLENVEEDVNSRYLNDSRPIKPDPVVIRGVGNMTM